MRFFATIPNKLLWFHTSSPAEVSLSKGCAACFWDVTPPVSHSGFIANHNFSVSLDLFNTVMPRPPPTHCGRSHKHIWEYKCSAFTRVQWWQGDLVSHCSNEVEHQSGNKILILGWLMWILNIFSASGKIIVGGIMLFSIKFRKNITIGLTVYLATWPVMCCTVRVCVICLLVGCSSFQF